MQMKEMFTYSLIVTNLHVLSVYAIKVSGKRVQSHSFPFIQDRKIKSIYVGAVSQHGHMHKHGELLCQKCVLVSPLSECEQAHVFVHIHTHTLCSLLTSLVTPDSKNVQPVSLVTYRFHIGGGCPFTFL